jgi:hypothetical protein
VNGSERLDRARDRAADRIQAVIGSEEWATFDAERIALIFSGFDLTAPDIIEATSCVAEPYSETVVHAAVQAWREAMRSDPESGRASLIGAQFGEMAGASMQGAVLIGLLIGLMAAEREATSDE